MIDRCGSSCLCSAEQEIFKGNCVNKCNTGYTRQANGECTCPRGLSQGLCIPECTGGRILKDGICQCPENQIIEQDEDGNNKCVCKGHQLIFDKINNVCRRGKSCSYDLGPDGKTHHSVDPNTGNIRTTVVYSFHNSRFSYSVRDCKDAEKYKFLHVRSGHRYAKDIRWLCTTKQGYEHGFKEELLWTNTEIWELYCYDGELEILQDPYEEEEGKEGSCTLDGFIRHFKYKKKWLYRNPSFSRYSRTTARRDFTSFSNPSKRRCNVCIEDEQTSPGSPPDKQCYRSRSN